MECPYASRKWIDGDDGDQRNGQFVRRNLAHGALCFAYLFLGFACRLK